MDDSENPSTDMSLTLSDQDIKAAEKFLQSHSILAGEKIVFIQPACGPKDRLRPWPKNYIADLSDKLIKELNAVVILNMGPGRKKLLMKL